MLLRTSCLSISAIHADRLQQTHWLCEHVSNEAAEVHHVEQAYSTSVASGSNVKISGDLKAIPNSSIN